ncbi:unnamed protein product [Paramecium pentaurelia]|uniref:Uncharacterized protein n=1 Tax=Paramecium pentaurelia TaxID=43138 RepID=A0A8S1Y1E5_9CILI|nr:unnamed protein product [Paramecium pentaurelia]
MADFPIIVKQKSRIDHLFKSIFQFFEQLGILNQYNMNPQLFLNSNLQLKIRFQNYRHRWHSTKAILYDCIIHQMIKNLQRNLLRDVWCSETFQVNKKVVHPRMPSKEQLNYQ